MSGYKKYTSYKNTSIAEQIRDQTIIVDPYVNKQDAKNIYKVEILSKIPKKENYSTTLVAVGHDYFKNMNKQQWDQIKDSSGIILDIDGIVPEYLNPIRI